MVLLFGFITYSQEINYELVNSEREEIQNLPEYVKDSILYIALNPPSEKERRKKRRTSFGDNQVSFFIGPNNTELTFNPNENFIASGNGNSYELGYNLKFSKRFAYYTAFTIDDLQASATVNSSNTSYEYDIVYLGFRNGININLLTISKFLELQLSPAINIKYFMNGSQEINDQSYDISNHPEFTGISFWGDLRFNINFIFNKNLKIGIGYSVSDNKTLFGSSDDSVISINQNQEKVQVSSDGIRFNLTYFLNKN